MRKLVLLIIPCLFLISCDDTNIELCKTSFDDYINTHYCINVFSIHGYSETQDAISKHCDILTSNKEENYLCRSSMRSYISYIKYLNEKKEKNESSDNENIR